MENKIAEMAQSIYKEGVEKADIESRRIIGEAESAAKKKIDTATLEAEAILADARRKAEELKTNTAAEIQLAGRQALAGLKQSIMDLVMTKAVDQPLKPLLSDPAVLKDLIMTTLQNFKSGTTNPDLQILLPASKQKELDVALGNTIKDLLAKGIEIKYTETFQAGFQIGPKNGTFKVSMTDSDFSEFFKSYLRPRTREFIFGK